MPLDDRFVWLITGSSRGLGRAFAEGILERGDIVVATARKPRELESLAHKYAERLLPVALDVTIPEQAQAAIERALERYGRLDVLVNNAGYGLIGAFEEMSPEQFGSQISTNFFGVVNMCRAALPVLDVLHWFVRTQCRVKQGRWALRQRRPEW